MHVQARPVISFLNALYPSDAQVDPSIQRESLSRAAAVSITALPTADRSFEFKRPPNKEPRRDVVIQFRRLKADVERIRNFIDEPDMSAGNVGGFVFDYYRDEVLGS
jgi:hypothetical protein